MKKASFYQTANILTGYSIFIFFLAIFATHQINFKHETFFITTALLIYTVYTFLYHFSHNLSVKKVLPCFFSTIISVFMIFYIINTGAEIHEDTSSYTLFQPMRYVIYPIFLFFFRHIVVSDILMLVTNASLGIISAYLLSNFILKKSFPDNFHLPVIFLILLMPYLRIFPPAYSLANVLIAESIAYALFLLFIYALCKLIDHDFRAKNILFFNMTILLILLTRGQFTYSLYLVIFILVIFLFIKKHPNKFKFLYIFLISAIVLNFIQITYSYLTIGVLKTSAVGGVQLTGRAFFVSKQRDTALFTGNEKRIYKEISDSLDAKKLRYNPIAFDKYPYDYFKTYEQIIWDVGFSILKKHQKVYDWHEIDRSSKFFAFKIIRSNSADYIKTALTDLKTTSWGIINFLDYLILDFFLIVLFGVFYFIKKDSSYLIITLVLIMQASQIILVTLTVSPGYRFVFYYDFVFLIIVILFANYLLKKHLS